MLVVWTTGVSVVQACLCTVVFFSFTALGHVLVLPVFYSDGNTLDGFIWGSIAGVVTNSLIISMIVYAVGWNLTIILAATMALPMLILICLLRRTKKNQDGESDGLYCYMVLALIVVTLLFYFPFKNLGALVGDKYLYAWLFGHDFINRIVHVESLSRGIPLRGMFFEGEKLSYYWLAYVFPAMLHNMKGVTLEIKQLLQVTQLFYSLMATAALILFLKKHIRERKILVITIVLALCCYSYVWIINLGIYVWTWFSSWFYPFVVDQSFMRFSGFSHGFYRFFFVEPQSILAISVVLMILILYETSMTIYRFILVGVLIGLLFGVEATNGIMLMLWFGCVILYSFMVYRYERLQTVFKHSLSIVCAFVVYAALFFIEMYSFSTGKGALQLSPNWFALKTGIIYFPLIYGPPFMLGMAGLIMILKKREEYTHWVYHYVLLLVIGLFFALFIQNPTEYHFGLLKATRVIPISLLMLSLYYLQTHLKNEKIGKVLVILIAMAFPSLISDSIIASDISNPSTFVRASDMNAARWMKKNLPRDAIVQAEPNYPGADHGVWPKYAYSFIPIFAERMTAIGEWKVSSQEHGRPEEVAKRFHSIREMYSTLRLNKCIEILNRYDIQYVFVGELERSEYRSGVEKFGDDQLFERVYSRQNTSIYKVNRR